MSKLSLKKDYNFVEHCNWSFYTPYLGYTVELTNFTIYNVYHGLDRVVHNTDPVIYINV